MERETREQRVARALSDRPQGADPRIEGGVRYRIWAPEAGQVEAVVLEDDESDDSVLRVIPMEREPEGYFSGTDMEGGHGDFYKFRLNGKELVPDPFSRWQAGEPHSASVVIDPREYRWTCDDWRKIPLAETVIYELHVGTFTSEGTFRAAIEKLDHLVDLGVTTIELMPLAAFPGSRNWGYDGVMLFAPDSSYGHPDDLRALVDAAHKRGLNVFLDVVYNHFGPEGNFLPLFSPHYFDPGKATPWGEAIAFSGPHSRHVRAVFLANAAYWIDEFRFDGLRLDATHAILDDSTPHILTEIARVVHERDGVVVAEDERNLASLATTPENGGAGIDAIWADDFHHVVRVALTGEKEAYFQDFTGSAEEIVRTVTQGWFYTGQVAPALGKPRGTSTEALGIEKFVHCISNHDQVGNHVFGKRLHQLAEFDAYRAATVLLCLTPGVPLLFMGQEWAAGSPFFYFTDHNDELGEKVSQGRRKEFTDFFDAATESVTPEDVPDPQDEKYFKDSKLRWVERSEPQCARILTFYSELLRIRANTPAIVQRARGNIRAEVVGREVSAIRFSEGAHAGLLLLLDLKGGNEVVFENESFFELPPDWRWQCVLSSNEERFGGNGPSAWDARAAKAVFKIPEAIVFQPVEQAS